MTPTPSNPQTEDNIEKLRWRIRHSAAHVLAEAVTELFPEALPTIGPPIIDGFYYDFDTPRPFTAEDLKAIKERMLASVKADTPFKEREVSYSEALDQVAGNPYKVEILNAIPSGERITVVSHSDRGFTDLCQGGHVKRTGDIKAFELLKSAGAYWRGDEKRPMLQRIYGSAWESRDALKKHMSRLEELERRSHVRIGRDLGLFFFNKMSPGSPFFLPNGTIVMQLLADYVRSLYKRNGYQEVITPQVFYSELWKTSGHYDNFADNMFFIREEEQEFGLKPMNCPAAAIIFKSLHRSYRELPLRLADFGRLHRYERSGVVQGLTRSRSFTQDDAHIFCTREDIREEAAHFLDTLESSYRVFKLGEPTYALSLKPAKSLGGSEIWDEAETMLEDVLKQSGKSYTKAEGEGAFYGPKIDAFVPDALGRQWQLGTVQIDFNLPERFDLEYAAEDGSRKRPIIVHRAMLGSLERFLAVLLEHLNGRLPLWLSPVQVVVVPISDKHLDYGSEVLQALRSGGLRARIDDSKTRMNSKIRNATILKTPYILVVGDAEASQGVGALRSLEKGDEGSFPIESIVQRLKQENDYHKEI